MSGLSHERTGESDGDRYDVVDASNDDDNCNIISSEEDHVDNGNAPETSNITTTNGSSSTAPALSATAVPFFAPTTTDNDTTTSLATGKKSRHRAGRKRNKAGKKAWESVNSSPADGVAHAHDRLTNMAQSEDAEEEAQVSEPGTPQAEDSVPTEGSSAQEKKKRTRGGVKRNKARRNALANLDYSPTIPSMESPGRLPNAEEDNSTLPDDTVPANEASGTPLEEVPTAQVASQAVLPDSPTLQREQSTGLIEITLDDTVATSLDTPQLGASDRQHSVLVPSTPTRTPTLYRSFEWSPDGPTQPGNSDIPSSAVSSAFSDSSGDDDSPPRSLAAPTTPCPITTSAPGHYISPTGTRWDDEDEDDNSEFYRNEQRRMSEGDYTSRPLPPAKTLPLRPPARAGRRQDAYDEAPAPLDSDLFQPRRFSRAPVGEPGPGRSPNKGRPFRPVSHRPSSLDGGALEAADQAQVSPSVSDSGSIESLTGHRRKELRRHLRRPSRTLATARQDFIMGQHRENGVPFVRISQSLEEQRDMARRRALERYDDLQAVKRESYEQQRRYEDLQTDLEAHVDKLQSDTQALTNRINEQSKRMRKASFDRKQLLEDIKGHEEVEAKYLAHHKHVEEMYNAAQAELEQVKQAKASYRDADTQTDNLPEPTKTYLDQRDRRQNIENLRLSLEMLSRLQQLVTDWLSEHDEAPRAVHDESMGESEGPEETENDVPAAERENRTTISPHRRDIRRPAQDIFTEATQNGFSYGRLVEALSAAGYLFRHHRLAAQIETLLRNAGIYSIEVLLMARQHEHFSIYTIGHVLQDLLATVDDAARNDFNENLQRVMTELQDTNAAHQKHAEEITHAYAQEATRREKLVAELLDGAWKRNKEIAELEEVVATYMTAYHGEDGDARPDTSEKGVQTDHEDFVEPAQECPQCPKHVVHIRKLVQEKDDLTRRAERLEREREEATRGTPRSSPKSAADSTSSPASIRQHSRNVPLPSPPKSWRDYGARLRASKSYNDALRIAKEKREKERREQVAMETLRRDAYATFFSWESGIPDVALGERVNRWTVMTRVRV